MTLHDSVAKLSTLLPKLATNDAKFASDLIASFFKFKGLTPRQEPWIEKLIARAEKPVFSAPLSAPVSAVQVGGFEGVVALFSVAKAHLKFPKIRLKVSDTVIVLSLNGAKSKKPGHVSVSGEGKFPNRSFYGSVSPEGSFTPAQATYGDFQVALTDLLTKLASHPAQIAKDYAKLTGNCCFCGKVVGHGKEIRSALVGFGPDCAEHYGLLAEWTAAKADAQQASAESLAVSLGKATGAVAVTVTDGPAVGQYVQEDGYGPNPGDLGDYVEQTHPEFAQAFAEATFTPETLQTVQCKDCGACPETLIDCDGEMLCQGCKEAYEALWEKMKAATAPCFFCEKVTTEVIDGLPVCPGCSGQL